MTLVWQAAREAAANLADQYGTNDPYEIARNLGLDVYDVNMPDGSSGMILKSEGEPAEIFIEASDVKARRRFTCAHELGHFIERTDIAGDDEFSFRDSRGMNYDLHEFFADEFAGALLMPEREFLRRVELGWTNTDLAAHFNVSANAVEKRRARLEKNPST